MEPRGSPEHSTQTLKIPILLSRPWYFVKTRSHARTYNLKSYFVFYLIQQNKVMTEI